MKTHQTLSVIIPARNEAHGIGDVLGQFGLAQCQVIVVDGGSSDGTAVAAARHGATVIGSPPGRGLQMNRGAAAATGDALLFLHADTRLPDAYDRHIFLTLARPGVCAGAFRLQIDAPSWPYRLIERIVDWRCRYCCLPYGDQALFMTPKTFRNAGGFPDEPVMEDFDLVRRLRRMGRVELAPACVVTSARRWQQHGILRTALSNQACIAAYMLGVSPERIAQWRDKSQES